MGDSSSFKRFTCTPIFAATDAAVWEKAPHVLNWALDSLTCVESCNSDENITICAANPSACHAASKVLSTNEDQTQNIKDMHEQCLEIRWLSYCNVEQPVIRTYIVTRSLA